MRLLRAGLVLALLWPIQLFAQHTISGSIRDAETNEFIPYADIILDGETDYEGSSDDFGFYEIYGVKPGDYTLKISFLGYSNFKQKVTVSGDQEVMINLNASGGTEVKLDDITISATRASEETPTTFSNIEKEQIEELNLGQDIPILLDQTPSIVTTSDAGAGVGYTGLRIRGSDQSRINVTINGIPYNDAESQGVFWVNLPDLASSVESIQIQRGVGTSTNGAGAFGGTVNINTNKLNKEPYGEISASYGSFNTNKQTIKFGTGLIKEKFAFDGRLSRIASDGFVDRAESDLKSFYLSGGYYGKKTILRLNAFGGAERTYQSWWGTAESILDTNRTYNFYNYENQVDDYRQDHYQLHLSHQFSPSWSLNISGHYTRGRGFFEEYKGPEFNNDDGFNSGISFAELGLDDVIIGGDTITETSLIWRRWLDNHFYGGVFSLAYTKSKIDLTIGGGFNQYSGDHFGEVIWAQFASNGMLNHRAYEGTGLKNDGNIYAKLLYRPVNRLSLYLDLQYRYVSHEIAGTDKGPVAIATDETFHFFNPKAGITYAINSDNRLYTSFAIGNREPSRNDFIDAPSSGNPEHETLYNLELGYQFKLKETFSATINYYLMHYNNQLVLTGAVNDVGSAIRTNVDKSIRTGIELQTRLNLLGILTWDFNFTYSVNRIKEFVEEVTVYDGSFGFVEQQQTTLEGTDISFSPPVILGSIFTLKPVRGLQIALQSKFVSKQFLDNSGSDDRAIDAYVVNNLRLSYTIEKKFFKAITFSVLINNLFNHEYESNGYTYGWSDEVGGTRTRSSFNFYYPQAGINVLGGVTLKF